MNNDNDIKFLRTMVAKVFYIEEINGGTLKKFLGSAFLISKKHLVTNKHLFCDEHGELFYSKKDLYLHITPYTVDLSPESIELHPEDDCDIAIISLRECDVDHCLNDMYKINNLGIPMAGAGSVIRAGQKVHLAGHLAGDNDTVSIRTDMQISGYNSKFHLHCIHTTVGSGMSGGAVVRCGNLVGVIVAREEDKNYTYVIPLNRFKEFLLETVGDTNNEEIINIQEGKIHTRQDISKLKVPTCELVGRGREIGRLYGAFKNNKVSVVGISADGGIGKTALIHAWLDQLNYNEYGLTHVYAYSFHETTSSQFFEETFKFYNIIPRQSDIEQPIDKAMCLLEALPERTILVLDELENLQEITGSKRGKIKDEAIRLFLENAVANNTRQKGRLILISSRQPLSGYENTSGFREVKLDCLPPEDGVEVLRQLGVKGNPKELEEASKEMGGHCLSLVLLGKLINAKASPKIDYRYEIYTLVGKPSRKEKAEFGHAKRIMIYYNTVIASPSDKVLLMMMGLFHSAMSRDQRDVLCREAKFVKAAKIFHFNNSKEQLKRYGLLVENYTGDKWDSHPLVREHFREVLKMENKEYWRDAHHVLMDYFLFPENLLPERPEEFVRFYRAIHHGCHAHCFSKALEIYTRYIVRDPALGYSTNIWGLAADEVATLDNFFKTPDFIEPRDPNMPTEALAYLWGRRAFCLMSLGRLEEAIAVRKKSVDYFIERQHSQKIVHAYEQLSALYVMEGNLRVAQRTAEYAIDFSERRGCGWAERERALCRLGSVYYLMNDLKNCDKAFNSAKNIREQKADGHFKRLFSDYAVYYRLYKLDIAESDEELVNIIDDARAAFVQDGTWDAISGVDILVEGIATYRIKKQLYREKTNKDHAVYLFDKALKKIKRFEVYLPLYFLAEAEFRTAIGMKLHGDPSDPYESLTKARYIVESSGLRLLALDCDLMEARIFIEKNDAVAAQISLDQAKEKYQELPGFALRQTDITLLEGELAIIKNNKNAWRIISEAKRMIDESGRKSLLPRYYKDQERL